MHFVALGILWFLLTGSRRPRFQAESGSPADVEVDDVETIESSASIVYFRVNIHEVGTKDMNLPFGAIYFLRPSTSIEAFIHGMSLLNMISSKISYAKEIFYS